AVSWSNPKSEKRRARSKPGPRQDVHRSTGHDSGENARKPDQRRGKSVEQRAFQFANGIRRGRARNAATRRKARGTRNRDAAEVGRPTPSRYARAISTGRIARARDGIAKEIHQKLRALIADVRASFRAPNASRARTLTDERRNTDKVKSLVNHTT